MNRYQSAQKAGILGILGNIFLLIIKGFIGILSGSQAMISDAVNSATDIISSFMTFIGNKISNKPEDEDHNFGHGKSEYIFSLLISISMIIISAKLFFDSILSLIYKNIVEFSVYLVLVCIITIFIKLCLFVYTHHLSKKFNNILLDANSKDHRNDCIITTFTLISVILSRFNIFWFDGIVGMIISLWICYTGFNIFITSYNVLMDTSVDEQTKDTILHILNQYKEIKKIENLYSSPCGYKYVITLTIFVDGNMSVFESKKLTDALEKDICCIDKISDIIIHVHPM